VIALSAEWEGAIRTEAEGAYPNECCGILLGTTLPGKPSGGDQRVVAGIIPIRNSREEAEQYHRFQIEPEDLMRAEVEARKRGQDVLGFYHSHPDHPARPSDFDREHALPFYSYIIVAADKGKAGDFTSWELRPDRSQFIQEEIVTWR
jgi:proteasome lid subunit RPN8/RPN11